jgi:P4 family phage/plasmid primase-like protien
MITCEQYESRIRQKKSIGGTTPRMIAAQAQWEADFGAEVREYEAAQRDEPMQARVESEIIVEPPPDAQVPQPRLEDPINADTQCGSGVAKTQASALIVADEVPPNAGQQAGNEAANIARVKAQYFKGERRLRGFVAMRARGNQIDVRQHLFDDNERAFAWIMESERLGFYIQTDTQHALEFMRKWPTDRMHLWLKVPDGKSGARTFDRTPEGYAAMGDWIERCQGSANVYFVTNDVDRHITLGVSEREGKIVVKPREADVVRMVGGQVDVDHRTLDDAERDRVNGMFQSHEPRLNVITFTGGGHQGFPLFREPVAIDGDRRTIDEWKRINIALRQMLENADACESLDHVMRLPGTINLPDRKKRERGRVPALAYCIRFDDCNQWHDAAALPKSSAKTPAASKQHNAPRGSIPRESGQRSGLVSADISAQLNVRMADLARELLGEPNDALSSQTQLRYGTKGSLAIEIDGPKVGCWYDHENGAGGDALELIRQQKSLGNGEVVDWARQWLGVSSGNPTTGSTEQDGSIEQSPDAVSGPDAPTSDDAADGANKVAKIVAAGQSIAGTPAELYLRSRAITAAVPDCIRFRVFKKYCALVALATDVDGNVLAVQQVYLTPNGTKAQFEVSKRTNKAVDGWAEKSAVRLPGKLPLILAEGVETALSIWQATGQETWACLGVVNIGRAPVPEGADVIIARDGDQPGSKADYQIGKALRSLRRRGHSVSVATPPEGEDFNDVLVKQGAEAVLKLIKEAQPSDRMEAVAPDLKIGSDVEIAQRVREDLIGQFDHIIHAEGEFWRYSGTHWEPILDHELRRAVHLYDGAVYVAGLNLSVVRLGKGRIDSVLNECATKCADPDFFDKRPIGINCATGFILFAADGSATIEPHHRDHRCRHTLPGHWHIGANGRPPEGSLLHRLLDGVFKDDAEAAEKVALLSEVCGSAALGYATKLKQPRAVILFGQTAENGKSQILDLARGLLPPNATGSVPAGRMGDERHIIGLVGKLLNASDELSAAAVASDTFKSVVTGEPIEGRDVYKPRVEFRSMAQNLFATNNLPPFLGGMDRGVQRRLLVVPFNRTIPIEQRVENIGRRIAEEEADLLLAWAVDGASRLVRQRNFSIPPSCKRALDDWIFGADPVLAWLNECVEVRPIVDGLPAVTTREAYNQFRTWAAAEGFNTDKLSAINGFTQRVLANTKGVEHHRNARGRRFLGLVIICPGKVPF